MLAPEPNTAQPLARLFAHHTRHLEHLRIRFPRLSAEVVEDLVSDAYAHPRTLADFPHGATDTQLETWFLSVLRRDAIDHIRSTNAGQRAGTHVGAPISLDELLQAHDADFGADTPRVGADADLLALEHDDEVASFKRVVDNVVARADPATARLLRAKLADEKPAAIALREGWSKKRYERQLTRAYKRVETILASISDGDHCASIRQLLVDAQHDMLAADSQRAIGLHIESCLHCKAYRRRTLRERIAALLPFPLPAFIGRLLGRDATAELATAVGGGGGAAAAGIFATAGGKAAATICAGALITGGCITIATTAPRRSPRPTTITRTTAASPATTAAPSSSSPITAAATAPSTPSTGARRGASQTAASRQALQRRQREQQRRAREAQERRAALRQARARRAARQAGGEGEFGPQTTAPAPQQPAATPAASAPPVQAPAPAPPPAPAPRPATPPPAPEPSNFSNEFTP